jgi:RNA polymerase sigma-70 factor (ECF subfamily)
LRDGDATAVAEAYDQHAGAVLAFARRLVGDDASAEDLVHETFVTLRSAIRGFREQSSLRTFLISIAVNHARHHLRSARRRREAMDRFAHETGGGATFDDGSPETAALRTDTARLLTLALDELPLDQRVAFVLSEVEDRSAKEIAEIVGANEVTVRTCVFKAKAKLREALAKRGVR